MRGRSFERLAQLGMYFAGSCLALAFAGRLAGFIVNLTPSIPRGLYRTMRRPRKKQTGYYVLFCPDQQWPGFRNNPNYRKSYLANCPDGEEALIKPVAAWPGDTVTTSPGGVTVNGAIIHNSAPNTKDLVGKDLHPYAYGNYQVSAGDVWVLSTYSRTSFDSRYFGPIPVASVRNWLQPIAVEQENP